jgi:hypothetical protein
MTDTISTLAALLAGNNNDGSLRYRQAVITAVASDGKCTVKIAGSEVEISEVAVAAHVCPIPGATCWIATDGRDLFVQSTISPQGPAYATMRRAVEGAVGTSAWTDVSFGTRTDTAYHGVTVGSAGFTIIVPGWYQVSSTPTFQNTTAGGFRLSRLVVNGTSVWDGTTVSPSTSSAADIRMNLATTLPLAIGDVVGLQVWQNSGANRALTVGSANNILRATWIGPVAPNLLP